MDEELANMIAQEEQIKSETEDFELTLFDRLNVIKDTITKYGSSQFYVSFSCGRDSQVLHRLIDMALPGNKIPRVYINTGIEYKAMVDFFHEMQSADPRFIEIKPSKPIRKILEEDGYPFKSKKHSKNVSQWQEGHRNKSLLAYARKGGSTTEPCPQKLLYQFEDGFGIKVSDKCCERLKKEPARRYERETWRRIAILGLKTEEEGIRAMHKGCMAFDHHGKPARFKPLNPVSNEFEDWLIKREGIKLPPLYYPPFNFKRTGCKGCPFAYNLQQELDAMECFLPNERKQCEVIWKPVYDEYRRIGYRLKKGTKEWKD